MRPKLFALIAVSAVALVGCAATKPTVSPVDESDVKAQALKLDESTSTSVTIDPNEAQKSKTYEEKTSEFLSFIDPEYSGWTGDLPGEAELVAAGKLVCEQLKDGVPYEKVEAIKGSIYKFTKEQDEKLNLDQKRALLETPLYLNNQRLVKSASSAYCLDLAF